MSLERVFFVEQVQAENKQELNGETTGTFIQGNIKKIGMFPLFMASMWIVWAE